MVVIPLVLSVLSFMIFINCLQFQGRKVPWGLRWIKLTNYPQRDRPGPFPWFWVGVTALFLLVSLLILTGMTAPIVYALVAIVAVGTVAVVIAVILLFLFTILVIISALLFATETMSARRNRLAKRPTPEKSKRKPKRKNDWLQHDSA